MLKENMSPNKFPQQSTLDIGHDPKPSNDNSVGKLKAFHGNEDKKSQKKKLFDLSIFGIPEERLNVELKVGKRSKDLHVSKVEDLGHSNIGQENLIGQEHVIQSRISQENLDKSSINQLDLSNSRINKDYADQSTIDQENLDQSSHRKEDLDQSSHRKEDLDQSSMGREDSDRSRIVQAHSDDLRDGQDNLSKQPDVDEPRILQEHLGQSRISQELSGKSRNSQEHSDQLRAIQEDFNQSRINPNSLGHSRTGSEHSGQSRVAPGDLDQSSLGQEDFNHSMADQEHLGHSMIGQADLSHSRTELDDLNPSKNGEHDFGRSRMDQEIMPYEEPKDSIVTVNFFQDNDGKDVGNKKVSDGSIGCGRAPKKLFDLSIFGIPEGKLNLELKGRKESKDLMASQNMRKVEDFQLSESDHDTVTEVPEFSFFGVGEDCNKEEMPASASSTCETLHQVIKDGVVMNSFTEPDMAFLKDVGKDCNKQYTSEMSASGSSTSETFNQVLKDGVMMNSFIEPDMVLLKDVGEDCDKQYTSEMSASASSTAETLHQDLKDGVMMNSFIEPDMVVLKDALYGSTSYDDPNAEIRANEDTSIGNWQCQEVSEMEVAKDCLRKLTSSGKEANYSNVNMDDWTQDHQIKIDSYFLNSRDELQQSPPSRHYNHAEMQKLGPRSVRTTKTRTRSAKIEIIESSRIHTSDVEVEHKETLRILKTETLRIRTSTAESKDMESQTNAKIKSNESRSLPSNGKVKLLESSSRIRTRKPKVTEVKDTESRAIVIGNDTFKHQNQTYALRVDQNPELLLHPSPSQMPTLDTRERIDQWLSSTVEVKTKFEHWHSQQSPGQTRHSPFGNTILVSKPLSLSPHNHVHCSCIRCARGLHQVHLHIDKALSIPFSTEIHKEHQPKFHQNYAYKASTRKKNTCPPFPGEGSAPFVICKHCLQILQVPEYLPPKSQGSIQQLQCGACTKISKFYVVTS